jgi:hypothetical protein
MQLVAALASIADVSRALDLGSGLGYSALWIASAVGSGGSVIESMRTPTTPIELPASRPTPATGRVCPT